MNRFNLKKLARSFCLLVLSLGLANASVAEEMSDAEQLADFSLEELLITEITSLSRKAESLGSAPAAVFVISQTDIRRSGARSIPDLLRMVPGMQVAQIDGNKWAVTSRGSNGRFANNLLVMMDGRSIYDPLLSGVLWDVQDTDLASIERIEVIRGPGATMWGSNAVNGIVNIITKHAADVQDGNFAVEGGSGDIESIVRYSAERPNFAYRVFAKAYDREGNLSLDGREIGDTSEMARIGGRIDWDGQEGRELTISAEAYSGTSGEHRITRTLLPPYLTIGDAEVDVRGGFIMGRWSRDLGADSDVEVKAYFDSHKRNGPPFVSDRDTVDLDFQHRFSLGNAHDIIWGVNLRRSDETTVGTLDVNFAGQERVHRLISAFVQDEISLFDGNARLMIGSKFERNNFSDDPLEIEPSVRFSVNLSESSTFWASASRAARMPSRGEQDGSVTAEVIPAGFGPMPLPVPTVVSIVGDRGMISEMVTAYEMGYRFRTEETLVDFAVFYNDFTDQRSIVPGAPNCQPGGELLMLNPLCVLTASYAQIPLNLRNTNDSQTAGAELSIAKSMNESWQLQASYTYFRLLDLTGDGTDLGIPEDSPDHQISIRSMMDISHNMELDFWLRWVDSLDGQQIDSYTALDVRFAWSPMRSLTLTAGARNLIAGDHVEFVSEVTDLPQVQIEPEGFVELRWNF